MKIQFRKNEKLAYMAVAGVVILLLLAGVLLNWQRGAFTNNMLLLLSLLLGVLFFLEIYFLASYFNFLNLRILQRVRLQILGS